MRSSIAATFHNLSLIRLWKQGNGSRQLAVSFAMFMLTIVGLLTALVIQSREHGPWDPLGPYPQQTVLTDEPIPVGAAVRVVGVKCAHERTPIRTYSRWVSVSPAVVTVEVDRRTTTRDEGCPLPTVYENDWPPDAITRTQGWLANGEVVIWTIVGTDTPDDGHRQGVSVSWSTEPFEVGP